MEFKVDTKICSFRASVTNSMLTIFDSSVVGKNIVNEVKEVYLRQGFSWRKGNVDFYTIDSLGINIDVFFGEPVQISTDAITAIEIPFTVKGETGVSIYDGNNIIDVLGVIPEEDPRIGSIGSNLAIPPGNYAVVFEQGFMPYWDRTGYYGAIEDNNNAISTWGKLWFNIETNETQPKILKPGTHNLKLCPMYLESSIQFIMDAKQLQ